VQPPLSLLARGVRSTVLPWAAEHGTGVICYSPLASGLLTGRVDRERLAALDEDDWRRSAAAFQEPSVTRTLELVARLRPVADRLGISLPELALGWVLAQPAVTAAIVGARTAQHVEGWAGAADVQLDGETLREIDTLLAETGAGSDEPPVPPPHILASPDSTTPPPSPPDPRSASR
jgi:aryl-alcohol dehydrogenase-like predicted oxidoreductase